VGPTSDKDDDYSLGEMFPENLDLDNSKSSTITSELKNNYRGPVDLTMNPGGLTALNQLTAVHFSSDANLVPEYHSSSFWHLHLHVQLSRN